MASAASTEAGEASLGHHLAPGVQVRPERSGLLFYQRQGPRLFFLSSGQCLDPEYFDSNQSLGQWFREAGRDGSATSVLPSLSQALAQLCQKGVLRAYPSGP